MIYLVSKQVFNFDLSDIRMCTVEESLHIMSFWKRVQFDTEGTGLNPRLCSLLSLQFGNDAADIRIVVDCRTIDPTLYKDVLENKFIIGQNLKFDLQFLYKYGIVPRHVYDTMIVEQLLYLGYPKGVIKYSLQAIAQRRLGIYIDKTTRGEIIWRGLDLKVIRYAADDVVPLEKIMESQLRECKKKECLVGAKLECDVVPAMAYLEWCGIKLDVDKWKYKMKLDKENLQKSEEELLNFAIKTPQLSKFVYKNTQGDLFSGFDDSYHCSINWSSSVQVVQIAKMLGFNTKVIDKQKGIEKDSVLEKVLKPQKGINDEFLDKYFKYQECIKVCTTYGQGHLDFINPVTNRLHAVYNQLGAISGRMSSGSGSPDLELARLKGINPKDCKSPNMQQLPHNALTRSCFVSEEGKLFCSCDYSAMEARIGAEVYNEKKLIDEFLHGSGDTHAAYAKVVYSKELEGIETKDVKRLRPDLRDSVKSIEFAVQFGSDGTAVAPQLKISKEEAQALVSNLLQGMQGLANFKIKGSKEVREKGYVVASPITGHKVYWWDHDKWIEEQKSFTSEFWDTYREAKEQWQARVDQAKEQHRLVIIPKPAIMQQVEQHFKAASKWDRMALNVPTQGGGAVVIKYAIIQLFDWIVDNGYFGEILLVNFTHDEINSEFPENLKDIYPNVVSKIMQDAAAKFYKLIPIPAEASVGDHWIH